MNISDRDRRALKVGGIGLGVILVGYCLILPWLGSWSQARENISFGQMQLANLQDRTTDLIRKRQVLAETFGQAAGKPIAPLESTRIAFLKSVQDLARSSGIAEASFQFQPPKSVAELQGAQLVMLRLSGKCQLAQLAKCLAELKKSETLILVDQLSTSADERQVGQLEVNMVLATIARAEKGGARK